MSPSAGPESLLVRMKDRARNEVAQVAIDLFLKKGFDETTVDEICEASGLSRRTFFRYFRGKEDVVGFLFDHLAEEGCETLVARPADEDVWTALRHSMEPFVQWTERDRSRALDLLRLTEQAPALRASYLARVDRWRASLAVVLGTRLDTSSLRAAVISAACMGAYLAATRAWLDSTAAGATEDLGDLVDLAFSTLTPTDHATTVPQERSIRRGLDRL